MKLSGHTQPFAVLGHPIGHTLSPVMHNAALEALGMDAVYLAFDVDPARLMETLPAMANMGFGGVNLTVPLKEVAFNGLADLDESARRLGAVNTVEFLPGGLRGHNTDGFGFLAAVKESFETTVAGRSVFVLGCGGAGRAVALTCACEGAAEVSVTDLDTGRTERVTREMAGLCPAVPVQSVPPESDQWQTACAGADLVVQATPVGMKTTDEALLDPGAFHPGQMVLDMIYMYPETAFMRAAVEGGAAAANGLGMLMHQGARAFTIWTGKEAAREVMRAALEREVYG
jgi:shikimate dehydrogenase